MITIYFLFPEIPEYGFHLMRWWQHKFKKKEKKRCKSTEGKRKKPVY